MLPGYISGAQRVIFSYSLCIALVRLSFSPGAVLRLRHDHGSEPQPCVGLLSAVCAVELLQSGQLPDFGNCCVWTSP